MFPSDIHKVHCFFEQSGTFKNEFIKLGIQAEDYDIQNDFQQTDHEIDLFSEINQAYNAEPSIFDGIAQDDLIMAFFPCIYFCDAKTMFFKGIHIGQKGWSVSKIMEYNIEQSKLREQYFVLLMKLFAVCDNRKLRLIVENPYNTNGETYLQSNFLKPTIIDHNRMLRGDYFVKPTAYWFLNCTPTTGFSQQQDKQQQIVANVKERNKGICNKERSAISPDYARNFICDFILGKQQTYTQPTLF